jgi:hypothetical protein
MKTLIIHPKDSTTDFLSNIYLGKNYTIINTNVSKSFLKKQIKIHDVIYMLGHGTENGLLGYNRFVIDSTYVYLLREKECICIWCNADVFVKKYNLKGFFTGMFISEYEESLFYSIVTDDKQIKYSNELFAEVIRTSLYKDIDNIKEKYDGDSSVIKFNRERFFINK